VNIFVEVIVQYIYSIEVPTFAAVKAHGIAEGTLRQRKYHTPCYDFQPGRASVFRRVESDKSGHIISTGKNSRRPTLSLNRKSGDIYIYDVSKEAD
jgi:hypothetical protein